MPDVTKQVAPPAPPKVHVYVYVEGGVLQASAANVPIELHIVDKDNHGVIDVEEEIKRLFSEHSLETSNVVENWVSLSDPGLDDHLDLTVEEHSIPD